MGACSVDARDPVATEDPAPEIDSPAASGASAAVGLAVVRVVAARVDGGSGELVSPASTGEGGATGLVEPGAAEDSLAAGIAAPWAGSTPGLAPDLAGGSAPIRALAGEHMKYGDSSLVPATFSVGFFCTGRWLVGASNTGLRTVIPLDLERRRISEVSLAPAFG